jgi:hypothetical protein
VLDVVADQEDEMHIFFHPLLMLLGFFSLKKGLLGFPLHGTLELKYFLCVTILSLK